MTTSSLALCFALFAIPADSKLRAPITAPKPTTVVNVDDLNFGYRPGKQFNWFHIPAHVVRLHGTRVRIYGNMQVGYRKTGIKQFLFSGEIRGRTYRSPFGRVPPHIQIPVYLKSGTTAKYTRKPVLIEGVFRIKPWIIDGEVIRHFIIEDGTLRETKHRPGFWQSVLFGC